MDKKPDHYLPNASTKEIRKLRLERYKLWHAAISNVYKGFIWIIFSALISVAIFYLNKFETTEFHQSHENQRFSGHQKSSIFACLIGGMSSARKPPVIGGIPSVKNH